MRQRVMTQDDYEDVHSAVDRASLECKLLKFANAMDFGIVSAALAIEQPNAPAKFVMIGNTPKGFLEASRSMENTQRDPVHRRLKTSSVPFTYDQSLYVEENASDLWDNQAPFGYRTGIAMALHLPGGKHFCLGVDRADPLPKDRVKLTRLMADLQLLAVYAQEAAIRLLSDATAPIVPAIKLTDREREVLQWARDGKSAWATGQIMTLSAHTVNFHIKNACLKLGVSNKNMAVLKAISLKLL